MEFEQVLQRRKNGASPETKRAWKILADQLGNGMAAAEQLGVNPSTARSWVRRWKLRKKAAERGNAA